MQTPNQSSNSKHLSFEPLHEKNRFLPRRKKCTADQHLCFRHTDSTIPLLLTSKVSSVELSSVAVQPGLCWTWSEAQIVGFLMHRLKSQTAFNPSPLTDDGAVRLWKNYNSEEYYDKELVTSFQALNDMQPLARGSGLVTHWEQESGKLLASGDVRFIRIWDSQKELKLMVRVHFNPFSTWTHPSFLTFTLKL